MELRSRDSVSWLKMCSKERPREHIFKTKKHFHGIYWRSWHETEKKIVSWDRHAVDLFFPSFLLAAANKERKEEERW